MSILLRTCGSSGLAYQQTENDIGLRVDRFEASIKVIPSGDWSLSVSIEKLVITEA